MHVHTIRILILYITYINICCMGISSDNMIYCVSDSGFLNHTLCNHLNVPIDLVLHFGVNSRSQQSKTLRTCCRVSFHEQGLTMLGRTQVCLANKVWLYPTKLNQVV